MIRNRILLLGDKWNRETFTIARSSISLNFCSCCRICSTIRFYLYLLWQINRCDKSKKKKYLNKITRLIVFSNIIGLRLKNLSMEFTDINKKEKENEWTKNLTCTLYTQTRGYTHANSMKWLYYFVCSFNKFIMYWYIVSVWFWLLHFISYVCFFSSQNCKIVAREQLFYLDY